VDVSKSSGHGIDFAGAGTLILDRMKISGATTGNGIFFRPSGQAKLIVTDSLFTSNGGTSTGAGILVNPQFGGSATVSIKRVIVSGGTFGIAFDGTGSNAGINATVSQTITSGNSQDGIIATTPFGNAPIALLVTNSRSTSNHIGIRSVGQNVAVRVDNSTVSGNSGGLVFGSGGALLSFGNNAVRDNGSDGTFSGSVALQ
jgi:hypothetical protein